MTPLGKVTLVGAGPGDPDLITIRGVRALEQADVVLYDRLAGKEVLKYANPAAELISVGKRPGNHSVTQDQINQLLVDYVKQGKRVVRLKNGDPFVFGRGGEETDTLTAAGIPFDVVPGITAAVAAGASCNLPLTKRGLSSCVTLVTGHEDPTKEHTDVNWTALAATKGTIVIYMAMTHLESVVKKLIESGFPPDMPAAVICRATRPDQKSVAAPIEKLPALVAERGLTPPSVVIIGRVVQIDQFE
jgi:uroporphyrinogen III methyltransferase/synthase